MLSQHLTCYSHDGVLTPKSFKPSDEGFFLGPKGQTMMAVKTEIMVGWIAPGVMLLLFSLIGGVLKSQAADEARLLDKEIFQELWVVAGGQDAQEIKINTLQINLKNLVDDVAKNGSKLDAINTRTIQIATHMNIDIEPGLAQ